MADDKIIDHTLYVHRDKDSNWYTWTDEFNQPENEAGRRFAYTGYEIGLATHVNTDTGECYAYGIIDGDKLVEFERPVRV